MNELVKKEEEKKKATYYRNGKEGEIVEIDMYTGEVVGTSNFDLVQRAVKYTVPLGNLICNCIREGMTMSEICKKKGMPEKNVVYMWRSLYPDFREKMDLAREDRGDVYFEKVLDTVEELEVNEDNQVRVAKEKVQAYKWAAEKSNARRYGNKTQSEVKHSGEIGFKVLNTGITRELPPDAEPDIIDAEYTTNNESSEEDYEDV